MTRNVKDLTFRDTDLASRHSGAVYRKQIRVFIDSGYNVELRFNNVVSVSESFADEAFGVLAQELGADSLGKRVRIRGASEQVLSGICRAIHDRVNQLSLA